MTDKYDLSRVPNLELRKVIADYYWHASETEEAGATAAVRAEIDAVREKYGQLAKLEIEPLEARLSEIEKPFRDADAQRGDKFNADLEAAGVEFEAVDHHEDYTGVNACALTGLPLFVDDLLGETPDGERFLFCILPEPEVAE